jgi:hypothetical protein
VNEYERWQDRYSGPGHTFGKEPKQRLIVWNDSVVHSVQGGLG